MASKHIDPRIALAALVLLTVAGTRIAQAEPPEHIPTPGVLTPAPVGHRQPEVRDLPPAIRHDEGARTSSEADFDKQLRICTDC